MNIGEGINKTGGDKMKKTLCILLVLSSLSSAFSQQDLDLLEEFGKQAFIIDSLQKVIRADREMLSIIANNYKIHTFDELIKSSTKQSVQRDKQLIGNNEEVSSVLYDLEIYFDAEEMIAKKFDVAKINHAKMQLNQIKQKSDKLDQLKDKMEYYQVFHEELKRIIEKLIILDGDGQDGRKARGDALIQKLKFQDIMSELSNYMYNYYDYANYPYLSNIVMEIIKRKYPDADADITDLLRKLQ